MRVKQGNACEVLGAVCSTWCIKWKDEAIPSPLEHQFQFSYRFLPSSCPKVFVINQPLDSFPGLLVSPLVLAFICLSTKSLPKRRAKGPAPALE
jgi:hypothetical protein